MIITIVIVTIIKERGGESVDYILQSATVSVCECVGGCRRHGRKVAGTGKLFKRKRSVASNHSRDSYIR